MDDNLTSQLDWLSGQCTVLNMAVAMLIGYHPEREELCRQLRFAPESYLSSLQDGGFERGKPPERVAALIQQIRDAQTALLGLVDAVPRPPRPL